MIKSSHWLWFRLFFCPSVSLNFLPSHCLFSKPVSIAHLLRLQNGKITSSHFTNFFFVLNFCCSHKMSFAIFFKMCIEEIEWKVTACNFGPLDGNKSQRQFVVDETSIFPKAASASGLIDERLIL